MTSPVISMGRLILRVGPVEDTPRSSSVLSGKAVGSILPSVKAPAEPMGTGRNPVVRRDVHSGAVSPGCDASRPSCK